MLYIIDLLKSFEFWQLIVTATIPIAIFRYQKVSATMSAVSKLREKSNPILELILSSKENIANLELEKIPDNQKHLIVCYINEYDHFCTLFNQKIISKKLAKKVIGPALISTYLYFFNFISKWREATKNPNNWNDLEICVSRLNATCANKANSADAKSSAAD
jgi:hypothetical protein